MLSCIMCRSHIPRDRTEEESEERPSFLNEDSSVDTELLTDGGDEEEEEAS